MIVEDVPWDTQGASQQRMTGQPNCMLPQNLDNLRPRNAVNAVRIMSSFNIISKVPKIKFKIKFI